MIRPKDLKILKSQSKLVQPIVQIGKNGLTDEMVGHMKFLLKKKKLVKIKLLKNYAQTHDRKKAAQEIVERTGAVLIEQIGFVIVIYKA